MYFQKNFVSIFFHVDVQAYTVSKLPLSPLSPTLQLCIKFLNPEWKKSLRDGNLKCIQLACSLQTLIGVPSSREIMG